MTSPKISLLLLLFAFVWGMPVSQAAAELSDSQNRLNTLTVKSLISFPEFNPIYPLSAVTLNANIQQYLSISSQLSTSVCSSNELAQSIQKVRDFVLSIQTQLNINGSESTDTFKKGGLFLVIVIGSLFMVNLYSIVLYFFPR